MNTDKNSESITIIACNPNAIPTEMREQWTETGAQIYAAVQEIQETSAGYRLRLPANSAMLLKVAEYLAYERLCCAFLRFILEIEPDGGPLWLHLTGDEDVKDYIRSILEMNSVLSEEVVKAADLQFRFLTECLRSWTRTSRP